ncbi:immunoglobulin superfamily member 6 [Hyperolius riggenbachi]|uniref:immunoglobulin superfamily member 6 n=1 Tax=Hyperolius riggenbachi TaxID=752182 RepID=UPI0035A34E16
MDMQGLGAVLFLQLVLHYQGGIEACVVTVEQEPQQVAVSSKATNISCSFHSNCTEPPKIFWFRFLDKDREVLNPDRVKFVFKTEGSSPTFLQIDNLNIQDSGVYICGIAYSRQEPTSKRTGSGTTLVVRDESYKMVTPGNIALAVICSLLFIYCAGVFSYYVYRSKWKICATPQDKDTTNKRITARRIFQTVAQEYHKRYDGKLQKQRNQVIEDDAIYQNTHRVP